MFHCQLPAQPHLQNLQCLQTAVVNEVYLFIYLFIYLYIHLFFYSLFKVDLYLTYKKTLNVNNNTAYISVHKLPNNNDNNENKYLII